MKQENSVSLVDWVTIQSGNRLEVTNGTSIDVNCVDCDDVTNTLTILSIFTFKFLFRLIFLKFGTAPNYYYS